LGLKQPRRPRDTRFFRRSKKYKHWHGRGVGGNSNHRISTKEYGKTYGDLDLGGLTNALSEQTHASSNGDLQRAEAMLTTQAHTLDAIFNNLAQRAINTEHMDNLDRYLKLALRAQSQCRSTWEALATIKYPPTMGYVRQANIANGPQQVNNVSTAPNSAPCAGEN